MASAKQALLVEADPCQHATITEIRAEGGAVLGLQCATCLSILSGRGICSGCGGDKALHVYVDKTRKRYCTTDCRNQTLAAERARKEAADEARRKAALAEMEKRR
tara:strand:+ start:495 stop:809 length:315 start_codon:yes stop_codon:yes gene_type:complete